MEGDLAGLFGGESEFDVVDAVRGSDFVNFEAGGLADMATPIYYF